MECQINKSPKRFKLTTTSVSGDPDSRQRDPVSLPGDVVDTTIDGTDIERRETLLDPEESCSRQIAFVAPAGHTCCLVPSCTELIEVRKDKSQRQKFCRGHQAAAEVDLGPGNGGLSRFCQRCARFHPIENFDGVKRSCRSSLEAHNLRRRRNRAASGANKRSVRSSDQLNCIVDDCDVKLDPSKCLHRRYKICGFHQQALTVVYKGEEQRFCQQCSRFHPLSEFDGTKHSCRIRLASHNVRRRKTRPSSEGADNTSLNIEAGVRNPPAISGHPRFSSLSDETSLDFSSAGYDFWARYLRYCDSQRAAEHSCPSGVGAGPHMRSELTAVPRFDQQGADVSLNDDLSERRNFLRYFSVPRFPAASAAGPPTLHGLRREFSQLNPSSELLAREVSGAGAYRGSVRRFSSTLPGIEHSFRHSYRHYAGSLNNFWERFVDTSLHRGLPTNIAERNLTLMNYRRSGINDGSVSGTPTSDAPEVSFSNVQRAFRDRYMGRSRSTS